ncbi:hypothetical protein DPEC_G00050680 [Dallia pectoralis]|uniref:Uncharacterized protein n=1 Tax=Dallia pectoralis TaxID=75939 RepID=A0ACC2HBF8_DALPE|nr:hypothetical protein DPEC_G00050680 [Dallia pectoralis]
MNKGFKCWKSPLAILQFQPADRKKHLGQPAIKRRLLSHDRIGETGGGNGGGSTEHLATAGVSAREHDPGELQRGSAARGMRLQRARFPPGEPWSTGTRRREA